MKYSKKLLLYLLILGLSLSLSCVRVYTQIVSEKASEPVKTDLIAEKAKGSTVRLVIGDFSGVVGSGFFVERDKIATNFLVAAALDGTRPIFATLADKEAIWEVAGVAAFDVKSDLVILKIEGEGTPLPLGDSDALQIGEPISAVSYPSHPYEQPKITIGVISSTQNNGKWIRITDAFMNRGSPVLNSRGQVIGIQRVHDASPSNALKVLIADSKQVEPLIQWQQREHVRAYVHNWIGEDKYNTKDYGGAIVDFNEAIKLNPESAISYEYRAKAKLKLGNHTEAIADFNQVIKLKPNDTDAYIDRADARVDLGDYTGAIADFNQVIKLKPDDTDAYIDRADARVDLGDYTGAIADFNQVIKLKPDDTDAYIDRADARVGLGDYTGAIADYTHAIKLKPDIVAYVNRADARVDLGDYTGAIADYTHAIKLWPEESNLYINRGVTKIRLNDYSGAIADYTHAIKLKPDNAAAYHNRGTAKKVLGQPEAAKIDFEKAKEIDLKIGK